MPLTYKVREASTRKQQQSTERRSLYIQVGNAGGANVLDAAGSNIPFPPYTASPCSSPMPTQRTLHTTPTRIPSPFDSNIAQYPGVRLGRSPTISASNAAHTLVSGWRQSHPYTAAEARHSGMTYFQPQQQQQVGAQHKLRSVPSSPRQTYSGNGSWGAEPPSTAQPRSLSRRKSIVLQSSQSQYLPLALPPPRRISKVLGSPMAQARMQPRRMSQPPTASTPAAGGAAAQSITSTKSLPQATDTGSLPQQDRRLSTAYERYPPLVSIFESYSRKSTGISCSPEDSITAVGHYECFPSSSYSAIGACPSSSSPVAVGARMNRVSTVPYSPSSSPWLQPEASRSNQEASAADALMTNSDWLISERYCQTGEQQQAVVAGIGGGGRSPATSFSLTTNHSSHTTTDDNSGGNEQENGAGNLRRSPSSTASLASAFSIASSSSTSSTPSSYAYIFDSARTPAAEDLLTLKNKTTATSSQHHPWGLETSSSRSRSAQNLLLTIADGSSFDNVMAATTTGHAAAAMSTQHEDVASVRQHRYLGAEADERTPLVGAAASLAQPEERQPTKELAGRESRKILGAAGYLLVGNALQALISMSQVAASGHLGATELAAIGLAHMVVILTGYPVAFSVLSCLETCASQAFLSAQPVLVGAYYVQAVQVLWALGLVLGTLWGFAAEPLLSCIMRNTSPEIVAAAASYLRWYFVPFMVFATMLCSRQVLYAQGITYPLPLLTLLGALATGGAQYALVFSPHLRLGIRGVALGSGIGYMSMLAATLLVIRRHNVAHIWGGMSVHAPWRPFVRLLPPCMALSLLSTGSSELITVAATQLGAGALTAQAVVAALSRIFMIVFSSIGVAALNRSGNLIGQQAARGAKVCAYVSMCIGTLCAIAGCIALLSAPVLWISLFTTDPQVIDAIVPVVPVAASAFFAQAVAFVCSQLLSAQGRQALAARIKFGALYGVGVPLAYYWAIVCGYGLWGLWAAVAAGQLCTVAVEIYVVLRTNWSRLVLFCSETILPGNSA
ncbi:ethionine resistance protein [Coemansia sp. RSA 1933]|nr:ethionine resistance protein [Coemansia sp. RSA 1933]